jgi:phosphoenolpyruvate-protein kinase (PTS system EI component)
VASLLVGLGIRRLSMSPISAARVRYAVRASQHSSLSELAQAALACDSAERVSALLSDALRNTLPDLRESVIPV